MVLIKSIIGITDYAEVQIKVFLYSCPQIVSEDPLKISGRLCNSVSYCQRFFLSILSPVLCYSFTSLPSERGVFKEESQDSVKVTLIQLPPRIRFAVLERLLVVVLPSLSSQFLFTFLWLSMLLHFTLCCLVLILH